VTIGGTPQHTPRPKSSPAQVAGCGIVLGIVAFAILAPLVVMLWRAVL